MKAVILAGGYGTRLSEKTDKIPKPMVEVGGKPLLWHIMKHFMRHGVRDFIICLGYKAQFIRDYFLSMALESKENSCKSTSSSLTVSCVEGADAWNVTLVDTGMDTGTGGRLLAVQHLLEDEPFFMTYGDGLSDVSLPKLLEHHKSGNFVATVTAVSPPSRYGFLTLEGDRAIDFQEKPPTPENVRINGGFFVLEKTAIEHVRTPDEMWEQEPMHAIVSGAGLGAYRHNGFWHCIDTLRDLNTAEKLWADGKALWKTWA